MNHENFFVEDEFFHDIEALIVKKFDDDIETINGLPDDFELEISVVDKPEPPFKLELDEVVSLFYECHEDRMPDDEGFDRFDERVTKAFKDNINFDQLNAALPRLYYPEDGRDAVITKQELLDYFKD